MIPKVSMDMQDAFSRRLDFADRLRNAQKNALKVASDLFASLQHRAFQGEL
jgi:hypothetical protein